MSSDTATDTFTTDQREREATGAHAYGRYLEEFEVGDVYKHWPAKTVTEADDHLFCLITMNHHPLHINDVYAAQSQQGRNVVVGPLVYSLALGMSVSDVSGKAIANLATEELSRTPRPVFHGDTLFVESEVLEKRESQSKPDRGTVQGPHRACSTRTACSSRSSSAWCSCRARPRQPASRPSGDERRHAPRGARHRVVPSTGPAGDLCRHRRATRASAPSIATRRPPSRRHAPRSSSAPGSTRSQSSPSPTTSTGATARRRSTTALCQAARRRRHVPAGSRDAKRPNSYLALVGSRRRRARRGPHLHLLRARGGRRPDEQLARARRDARDARRRCSTAAMRGPHDVRRARSRWARSARTSRHIGVQLTDSPTSPSRCGS